MRSLAKMQLPIRITRLRKRLACLLARRRLTGRCMGMRRSRRRLTKPRRSSTNSKKTSALTNESVSAPPVPKRPESDLTIVDVAATKPKSMELYVNRPLPPLPPHPRRNSAGSPPGPSSWKMKPLPPKPLDQRPPHIAMAAAYRRASFPATQPTRPRRTMSKAQQLTGCDLSLQKGRGDAESLLSKTAQTRPKTFSDKCTAWRYHDIATELAETRGSSPSSSSYRSSLTWSLATSTSTSTGSSRYSPCSCSASSCSARGGQASRRSSAPVSGQSHTSGQEEPRSAFDSDSSDEEDSLDLARFVGSIRELVGGAAVSTTTRIKRWSQGSPASKNQPLGVVCEDVEDGKGNSGGRDGEAG